MRSADTLEDARDMLDEFLDRGSRKFTRARSSRRQRICVAELCEAWFRDKKSSIAPATEKQYAIHIRAHITPGIGSADADAVRPRDIEGFYRTLRWKPAKESHNILRQALEWGLRNEALAREANPFLYVRPSRRACIDHDGFYDADDRIAPIDSKTIPTKEQVQKLLVDAEARDRMWWLYVKLASATGARPGELCALRRKDIDIERATLRIEWSADRVSGRLKRPKTRWSIRTLPIARDLVDEIADVLPEDPDAFLFPSNRYRGARSALPCWNSRTVKRFLDAALERVGGPHFTAHAFRHYVATHLLDDGWAPLQVARFLGHANDQLVRTLYANHIVDETQRLIGEAAGKLA